MSDQEYELPQLELELIDTTEPAEDLPEDKPEEQEAEEAFYFPLFGGQDELTKVALKEEEPMIDQSRPDEYYFAHYTEQEKAQFAQSALEYDQIFVSHDNRWKRKPLDLDQYNREIAKSKKRLRPSLKNRKSRIIAKQNNTLRKKLIKKLAEDAKKINQKRKRGGKKNKKKDQPPKPVKKYRTE